MAKKQQSHSGSVPVWAWAVAAVLAVSVAFGAYMFSRPATSAAKTDLMTMPADALAEPYWFTSAPKPVREAYVYSASHFDELQYIPCYCGCSGAGHDSVAECYFQYDLQGKPTTYDQHAYGCQICVEITQSVIAGRDRGKSISQLRKEIDKRYQAQGLKPTNTPMPPSTY